MNDVLVLNRSFFAVQIISWRRALSLVYADDARVVDEDYKTYSFDDWREFSAILEKNPSGFVHTPSFRIAIPDVISLRHFDGLPKADVKFTRRNIYEHYSYKCAYCGIKFNTSDLNLEHVIPRSRGGKTDWANIVTACIACNLKKGNRLPDEAGMRLLVQPTKPKWTGSAAIVYRPGFKLKASWQRFIDNVYWNSELIFNNVFNLTTFDVTHSFCLDLMVKKIRSLFLIASLIVAAPLAHGDESLKSKPTLEAIPFTWIHDGAEISLPGFASSSKAYLPVEQLSRLSDSQLHWQPMTQQVCLTRVDGEFCFNWEQLQITHNNELLKKKYDLQYQNKQLFVPVDFVTSPEFQAFSATEITWNQKKSQLTQQTPLTVHIPTVERLSDRYRLSLPSLSTVPHTVVEKNLQTIWIRFIRGRSDGSEVFQGDDLIQEVRVIQKHRAVDLIVKMGPEARSNDVYFDDKQQKLILDVFPKHPFPAPPALAEGKEIPSSSTPQIVSAAAKTSSAKKHASNKTLPLKITTPSAPILEPVAPVIADALTESDEKTIHEKKSSSAPLSSTNRRTRLIVIDAGHGGVDPGAIGARGTMEKNVNLQVAKLLAQLLRKEKNTQVILTRENDQFIPLHQRTAIANQARADLFVSIHCNASVSARNTGFEVYVLSPSASDKAAEAVARIENSVVSLESGEAGQHGSSDRHLGELLASMAVSNFINESSQCATLICRVFGNESLSDSTAVKEANFFVLRGAQMPAILIELDYISNPITELKLRSSYYKNKLAKCIKDGILNYARRSQKKQATLASRNHLAEANFQP